MTTTGGGVKKHISVEANLPMAKSDLITTKANFYPTVSVVDSTVHTLKAHSTVDTGSRVFTTDKNHHGLTTLVF